MSRLYLIVGLAAATLCVDARAESGLRQAILTIRAVGEQGTGNPAASKAWVQLNAADAGALHELLSAMDGANPLAANWLRGVVEVIASRTLEQGGELPVVELGEFLMDRQHDPRARRLAFDLIARADAKLAQQLVPGMLNDPSVDLRRDAVAGLLSIARSSAKADNRNGAILLYRQALDSARDIDQIQEITGQLREMGRAVDLPRHFGFLTEWNVIGPFHNNDRKGFAEVFPPEKQVDLAAGYKGKNGSVKWVDFTSEDEYGMIDINKPLGMLKEVTAYAHTEFVSGSDQPAELRLGCKNAWKVWLNGDLLFGRDEYHRGKRIDQYRMKCQLKKGPNTILVKLCQNEQKEDWTVEWEFQLRMCDAIGTAIHPASVRVESVARAN